MTEDDCCNKNNNKLIINNKSVNRENDKFILQRFSSKIDLNVF